MRRSERTCWWEISELLFETFNPRTMALLETISDREPENIRETARLVDLALEAI